MNESFDFAGEMICWYKGCARDLPWRKTKDPYAIWVSEIMLQQTRVEAVKPYYSRFLEALPNVTALAECDDELLYKLWEGLGYYSRVRNMKKAAITCVEKYGGRLPQSHDELLTLCGIGPYTAAAVSSIAYGEAKPAIDGNVLRVMARYLAIESVVTEKEAKGQIEDYLSSVIDQDEPGVFNSAMMELGATLCGPDKAARCGGCPLLSRCKAFERGLTESLPVRAKKAEKRVEERTLFIIKSEKGTVLQKRPPKGLLAGLWEPPAEKGLLTERQARALLEERGIKILSLEPLPEAKHIFTHVVWQMKGYLVKAEQTDALPFYGEKELQSMALPSAFSAYKAYI